MITKEMIQAEAEVIKITVNELNYKLDEVKKNNWIKALRSDVYEQCEGELCSLDDNYCCLGVFLEVNENLEKININNGIYYIDDDRRSYSALMPERIMPSEIQGFFSDLNDNSDFTFKNIADVVEQVFNV